MKVVHFSPEVMKRLHPLLSPYIAGETENFWFGRRTYVYNVVSAFFKHGCPLINSAVVGATRVVLVGSRWSDASPLLVPRLEASTSSLHSRDCLVKTRSRFACLTSVSSSSYFTNTAFFGRFSYVSKKRLPCVYSNSPFAVFQNDWFQYLQGNLHEISKIAISQKCEAASRKFFHDGDTKIAPK